MQPNKTKLALKIGAVILGAAIASSVSADPFTATITTIDDVTITEVNALTFGSNVFTAASTSCTMLTSGGAAGVNEPGATLMQYDTTADQLQGSEYGALTGDGCVNAPGSDTAVTPGVWAITGATGGTVNILVSQVAQVGGDFTFAPSGGCYVEYDGNTVNDQDRCVTLLPGTVYTTPLSLGAGDDDVGGGGAGAFEGTIASAGVLRFTLGGVISIGATGLTAETDYDLAFQVDVTY
jgi:hypothetical protein